MFAFEISQLLELAALLLVIGALSGVIAGLLGVGGGIILVPAFYYMFAALGYDSDNLMQICVATSLATIIFTSIRSVLGHHKKGAVHWDILKRWAPGIASGAVVGVLISRDIRSVSLMVIFGILGTVVGLYLAFGRQAWRLGAQMPQGIGRAITSPMLGFLSVLMGIGGGSFGVPLMTLFGQPIHRAIATSAGFGVIIAVPSVLGFLMIGWEMSVKPPLTVGLVNFPAFAIVVSMTLLTAPLGVRLAHAMNPKPLKAAVAFFIMLMALNMLRKAFFG
ncbi:MAG: sulfite exporter TauE/SafE family protein [Paracoccaceae bacterium]